MSQPAAAAAFSVRAGEYDLLRRRLVPGYDQFYGAAVYEDVWAQQCRELGATPSQLAAARARMTHDRCADVASQLRWRREAGFRSIDCIDKSWRSAVLAAWMEAR